MKVFPVIAVGFLVAVGVSNNVFAASSAGPSQEHSPKEVRMDCPKQEVMVRFWF